MTTISDAVVSAFGYPGPETLAELRQTVAGLPPGPVRGELKRFVSAIGVLELGEWEETHTRTLDLSPLFVPYVGHLVWGESYRRGAFMAELQRAQLDAGVDQHGELPDHIVPILEYLDRTDEPLADLVEVLPSAMKSMLEDLRKTEPTNPYLHVLAAASAAIDARLGQGVTP